jgi:hypothetical protein
MFEALRIFEAFVCCVDIVNVSYSLAVRHKYTIICKLIFLAVTETYADLSLICICILCSLKLTELISKNSHGSAMDLILKRLR